MANIIAGDPRAIRSQMQKVRCRLYYQKRSKKRHQSTPNYDTPPALLHCVKCSSSHLAITAPAQRPVEYHWTRNSRASLSSNPSVPRFHQRLPLSSCPVKLLRVLLPAATPGAELLLHHHWSFRVRSAGAAGPWGSQPNPREEWLRRTPRSGDAKMQRRLMPPLRAITVTFSSFYAVCLNYRALPDRFNWRKQSSGSVLPSHLVQGAGGDRGCQQLPVARRESMKDVDSAHWSPHVEWQLRRKQTP